MHVRVRLVDILTPELIRLHDEHIRNFFVLEGITPDPVGLEATILTERQVKELLEELAEQ